MADSACDCALLGALVPRLELHLPVSLTMPMQESVESIEVVALLSMCVSSLSTVGSSS